MNEAQQLIELFRNSVGPKANPDRQPRVERFQLNPEWIGPRGRHGGSFATRFYETVLPRSKYSPKSLIGKR